MEGARHPFLAYGPVFLTDLGSKFGKYLILCMKKGAFLANNFGLSFKARLCVRRNNSISIFEVNKPVHDCVNSRFLLTREQYTKL